MKPRSVVSARRCWYGTHDAGQACEFVVRDDFEVNNLSQGAYSLCVHRHDGCGPQCTATTARDWEKMWTLSRKQVSKSFITQFRGYLAPQARNAYPEPCSHVEIVRSRTCCDDHMRGRPKTVPLGQAHVLGKGPACMSLLASWPSRKLQEPVHDKFVHCIGSTRRSVRKPTINADETERARQVLPLPTTS